MDKGRLPVKISIMTAIRVIFDGKAFIPQQSVSLPDKSEALVLIEQNDPRAGAQLDAAIRAYYQNTTDVDDDAWAAATSLQSQRAWDED
ncbi:MAG TPA: antitoxin family protein [Tepidisphaeraceae bacterium]|nr:antitoxin family protein [Tepidisphaeraceae bacterium]